MTRVSRSLALLLLALLLPLQGYAAACAQICAIAGHAPAPMDDGSGHHQGHDMPAPQGAPAHGDCDNSTRDAGKCCQAHVFAIDQAPPMSSFDPPAFARSSFVARWTNFIPEEPSPPPIAGATDA